MGRMRVVTLDTWGMRGNGSARFPVFQQQRLTASASDHYGLAVALEPPPEQ